ncbi:DoxX family protein [Craterilacuibacter sp. RT1T]|uniref:DoxX family protein n=1 Tax=Craterilacuibacter sp. RT1T TaxID=2942211 RepID=UPI0020C0B8E6|nr:DoxX family protein [Craterilacuibacter sp. RT1T]MCL6264625.1 DoxX family protein [Craterilacuibacter sp. RT1T]
MNPLTLIQRGQARYRDLAQGSSRLITPSLIALAARVGIAATFFLSGRTKVEGWLSVSDSALLLFRDEYQLPVLPYPLAAHLATYAEHLFPLMLLLGLFTRLSALALLGMTVVIQVFVYPDAWLTHLTWAAALLYLLGRGGGRLSLDRTLGLD